MTDYDEYLIDQWTTQWGPYFSSKEFYDLVEFFISGGLTYDSLEAAAMFVLETYLVKNSTAVVAQWGTI